MEKTEKSKKASWNAAKDTFLLDELVAAKRMGHKTELGFKKFVWNDACARLNDRFMTNLDKGQLKCRFQVVHHFLLLISYRAPLRRVDDRKSCLQLRKQYNTFVSLKNDERFNWDEERQAIIASDADWDRYLEVIMGTFFISTGFKCPNSRRETQTLFCGSPPSRLTQ
ncbi:hypothetical protein BOTBODRAFT_379388 [Botryobasidium botryosum FD-172 SS1]|uniref:Myb/SANT-like domain-containing protein n=1 Tax=Botryobasidium botryosum (strain FD-172 SS1) TaxID=930990 RepID=A0A067MYU2_BOTB1|nr:hypothetical protein BOTBODRAFT_379388 [Botryobasidium botryosum FD-172 SS1]